MSPPPITRQSIYLHVKLWPCWASGSLLKGIGIDGRGFMWQIWRIVSFKSSCPGMTECWAGRGMHIGISQVGRRIHLSAHILLSLALLGLADKKPVSAYSHPLTYMPYTWIPIGIVHEQLKAWEDVVVDVCGSRPRACFLCKKGWVVGGQVW